MVNFNLGFIKSRRLALGISTETMARALGLKSYSTYWKYENGKHKFKAEKIPLLAKILQCEPQNFFISEKSAV